MDHDTYSANDAIGKVYFNLNPLLLPQPTVVQLSGQQSLADTLISNQSQTTGKTYNFFFSLMIKPIPNDF